MFAQNGFYFYIKMQSKFEMPKLENKQPKISNTDVKPKTILSPSPKPYVSSSQALDKFYIKCCGMNSQTKNL